MTIPQTAPPAQVFGDLVKNGSVVDLSPAAREAIELLQAIDVDGRHNLVAIEPGTGPIDAITIEPRAWGKVAAFIEKHNGAANIYYSANEPAVNAPQRKLTKRDIAAIRCLFVDLDPDDGMPLEESRRVLATTAERMQSHRLAPTMTVDSGGGVQMIWRLTEKLMPDHREWAEQHGRGLARMLSADTVQNIDRLLRLPGTINIPDARKAAKGRERRPATILRRNPERSYSRETIGEIVTPASEHRAIETDALVAAALGEIEAEPLVVGLEIEDLPDDLQAAFAAARGRMVKLDELWRGEDSGLLKPDGDKSGSAWRIALACRLAEAGDFDAADYAQLACAWPIVAQSLDNQNDLARALARDWGRFGATVGDRQKALIDCWFEDVPDEPQQREEREEREEREQPARRVEWIDPAWWEGRQPAPREWEVEGWIPKNEVTLLYGDGGIGKTLLAHQYATCAAAGVSWLGQTTRSARVMCFFCEDSADELHRRQVDINAAFGVTMPDLARLRLASRKHEDNLLATWDRNGGRMKLTQTWSRLRDDAMAFGADVLIVDTIADVYGGSEIDRVQVSAFVKTCLGGLAKAIGGSVIALGHPSMSGKSSGQGTSGSTAWSNAARSRLYLRYPKGADRGNIRELEGMKLNYGPRGSVLKLRWQRGAFAVIAGTSPVSSETGERVASIVPSLEDTAERAVLNALADCAGDQLSPKRNSPYFAPKVLKRRAPDLLDAFSDAEVDGAMQRLEKRGVIRHEEIGRSPNRHPRLGYTVVTDKLSGEREEAGAVFD